MLSLLFVCTGNYYRSRVAEILFNHYAQLHSIPARASSRGFRLNPAKNIGKLSAHAPAFLNSLNIAVPDSEPSTLSQQDLKKADRIIVLDENEHRPMMKQYFPEWEDKVEYWQFEDDYVTSPMVVLPALKEKIMALREHMSLDRTNP